MSYSVLTLVTNRAKQRFQEAIRLGYGIQATHFVVGDQGHSPDSPITALTPDRAFDPSPDLSGNRIPEDAVISPLAVTSAEDDPNYATVWVCDLDKGVATGVISSIYLLAKVVYPVTHPEYDLLWVYSVGYTPQSIKTDNETRTLRIGVQY